jgi:Acyl-CoA oxidase
VQFCKAEYWNLLRYVTHGDVIAAATLPFHVDSVPIMFAVALFQFKEGRTSLLHGVTANETVTCDLQGSKVSGLRRQMQQMLRPNAISLVDSWAFTDYELNSALGRQDGDVYRALLSMAKGSPLNKTDEGPAWEAVMKPAIEKLQRSKL